MNPSTLRIPDDGAKKRHPPRLAGFVLASGDSEIFRLLYEYRFLRREQMSVLIGRDPKRLHRRLLKLVDAGYLTSKKLPQQKHIYGLAKAGQRALVEEGRAGPDLLDKRFRLHELSEYFLKHEMMIADVHVILSLAGRSGALKLISWREGRGLHDSVTVAGHDGVEKSPFRPDAFFALKDSRRNEGQDLMHFFLEADRSRENHPDFGEKIPVYWHYLQQGLHEKQFGIKSFRMITVTITDERARKLAKCVAELVPQGAWKYFLFTSCKNFSLDNPAPIFDDICLRPGGSETDHLRYPLVRPPQA
jgi:hypothetical protein